MKPDPCMETILKRMRAAPAVDYRVMPISQGRQIFEDLARPWTEPKLAIARAEDLSIPIPGGAMRARLYCPGDDKQYPLVLFAHGGGWTFGSVDSHDGTMRHLAHYSGCAVLGMDYRLAPEHPFPAALDDLLAAIRFAEDGHLGVGIDATRIALAGDSAGANLALAALLSHRESARGAIATAALFYGCYTPIFDTDSHRRCGDGAYLLSTEIMRWFWRNFLGTESDMTTSLAAPLRADLAGLPPLYLNAAGLDPLLDDTLLLSRRLAEMNVRHHLDVFPGVVHGFLRMMRELPAADEALRAAGDFLARMLK